MIESASNPRFKQWRQFCRHPEDRAVPWIPVEGRKQVAELAARLPMELLLFSTEDSATRSLQRQAKQAVRLPGPLLERLGETRSSQGVIAFFEKPSWDWAEMPDFILYVDGWQDPGNLGALLRSARAAGGAGLVTAPHTVSPFNAKAIRASAAAVFFVPCLQQVNLPELTNHGYRLVAAVPRGGENVYRFRWPDKAAVLLGSEGSGLGQNEEQAEACITIPTHPDCESLNAAIAGSVILFEYARSRGNS